LSLKTKFDDLSVVWPQNHWDDFSRFGLKTGGDGFSRFGLKIGGFEFPGLGFKTSNYGLVIWASKSLQQFLRLGLKTKRTTFCRLRHKIDGRMKTLWDMHQDLVACFAWSQVGLGFPNLASRLVRMQSGDACGTITKVA
jgi:hypothetical protein